MSDEKDIPRWAKPLGIETWERINELLQDGWDTLGIMAELAIPASKKRSLQIHARKYGPRRRLERFARFKDAMLGGAADIGPDFAKALKLIAFNAVSPNVKESTQRRACELMNEFAKMAMKLAASDEKIEEKRKRDERGTIQVDPEGMVDRVLDVLGVVVPGRGGQ